MNFKSTFALGFGLVLSASSFATSPMAPIKAWETQCGDYKVSYTNATHTMYISWEAGGYGQVNGTPVSTMSDKFRYETLDNGMAKGKFVLEQELGRGSSSPSLMVSGAHVACGPMKYTR